MVTSIPAPSYPTYSEFIAVTTEVQDQQQRQPPPTSAKTPTKRIRKNWLRMILLHVFGIFLYLIPLTTHPYDSNNPVLDELHVCSSDNVDINGPLPFLDIFKHDYWGRPMTAENSHKSWRPFTILSFRYLGGGGGRPNHHPLMSYANRLITTLTLYRLVNVVLHAATADLVGLVATRLFGGMMQCASTSGTTYTDLPHASFVLYALVKLLFLLHPTHVEVTANAANRNHLLATMCSLLLILLMQQQRQEECEQGVSEAPSKTTTATAARRWGRSILVLSVWMPLIILFGFGASETFLFQIPAILVTATVLEFVRLYQHRQLNQQQLQKNECSSSLSPSSSTANTSATMQTTLSLTPTSPFHLLLFSLWNLRFHHLILVLGALAYAFGRYYFDTLKIPDGLLRPAENPFAHFKGWKRIWNYAYITALHIMKSVGLDVVGFSHEYGERCIEPIRLRPFYDDGSLRSFGRDGSNTEEEEGVLVPEDIRIALPMILVVLVVVITLVCIAVALPTTTTTTAAGVTTAAVVSTPNDDDKETNDGNNEIHASVVDSSHNRIDTTNNLIPLLLWLMHLSWLITLFPIMGFVKVGTFVSDRIVVPSTVSVCILLGAALTRVLAWAVSHSKRTKKSSILTPVVVGMILMVGLMWRRIHVRSLQWMDSLPLLSSSLETCPNFAKGHLEISKVYSGLYPEHFNLTKSRWHLHQVERIDPTYCDVHQQFAHVALQELNYVEFEERLVQAMLCPFTMGGAVEMWKRYWQAVLSPNTPEPQRTKAQQRQNKYTQQIQKAVAKQ